MTIRRILLPTDLSDLAAKAAQLARSMADKFQATLYVLHVREPSLIFVPSAGPDLGLMTLTPDERDPRGELDAFVREHLEPGSAPVVAEMVTGPPVAAITQFARTKSIDLIVIGTHARGLVNRLFLGSVSEAVMEKVSCPVLMVPP